NIGFSTVIINFVQPTPTNDNLNNIPTVNVSATTDNGAISVIEAYVNDVLVKRCLNTNTCYVLPDETGVNITSTGFINYKFTAITTAAESKTISKSFFIDKVAPDIKFSFPTPNENAVVNGTITINAEGKDNSAGTGIANVSIFIDGNLLTQCINNDPFAPPSLACNVTINTAQYNDGNHTINVIAYDVVGNTGTKTRIINFDNNLPFITFSPPTPSNNSAFSIGAILVINATSTSQDLRSIDIFIDNNLVYSCNAIICAYSWNTTSFAAGQHSFYASATDNYGNVNNTETRFITLSQSTGGTGGGGGSSGGSIGSGNNNGESGIMLIVTNKLCPENKIQFKVKDINGTSIANAEIRVTKKGSVIPDTFLTDNNGIAYYTIKENATYSVSVNANGYSSKTFELSISLCSLEEKNETIGEFLNATVNKSINESTNESKNESKENTSENKLEGKNETNSNTNVGIKENLSEVRNETNNEENKERISSNAGNNIGFNFSGVVDTIKTLALFAVPIAVLFVARALFRRFIMP
ncbi:MAG: Ig-like domain-containing protein, partial [Candidatus Anstonellales archaeon]